MKKLIILMTFMAVLSETKSQTVSLSVPLGFSSYKLPMAGVNAHLAINRFIIAAGVDAQMSRKVKYGDLYWVRTGVKINASELNHIELTAGAAHYLRSNDTKRLNEGLVVANVQYVHQMQSRPEASIFAGITATNKFSFVSGGLRFTFNKKDAYGCPSARMR